MHIGLPEAEFTSPSPSRLSDEELRAHLQLLVRHERKITAVILEHLSEVECRELFFQWGFASIFEYLTRELGYSESAAYRRLQAARALNLVPGLKEKIEAGTLKLSQVAEAQTSIRQEEKCLNDHIDIDRRQALFAKLENKTTEESRKILVAELPTHTPWTKPSERQLRDESVQLSVHLEKTTYRKLTRVRDLYSHIEPQGPWPRVLDLMADDVILKRDPAAKPRPAVESTGASLKGRTLRAFIFLRDQGRCQHKNSDGSICGSTYQLEIDHIQPKFAGGTDTADNLRLLCRAHNQHRYRAGSGIREMKQ